MITALIGQKIEQTQKFLENGRRIPVTEIALPDNVVVQVKTKENDGYTAVQLGFGKKKRINKAFLGHLKKAKLETAAFLKEVVLQNGDTLPTVGDFIAADTVFKPGDIVAVTGISKGKGFAGVVKRHHFRGGPKTHGQSDRLRAPGSIGQTTTPGRVYRGKRMAGHMGEETATVRNLQIVGIDAAGKKISVMGLVPGHLESILFITKTGESKKFIPLLTIADKTAENAEMAEEVAETSENTEAPKEEAPQNVVGENK